MQLLSIQVGKPKNVFWEGDTVSTGIFKLPVKGPVRVARLNLDGDGQADLSVHGGADKAVYGYPHDAYAWWEKRLAVPLQAGAFGENLTIDPLDEKKLCIGDTLSIGDCHLEISEPRFPCFKLGIKFQDMKVLKTFIESGRPGIYFRVIQEGTISAGQPVKIVSRDKRKVSVSDFFRLKIGGYKDLPLLEKLLSMDNLSQEWREKFSAALAKHKKKTT